MCLNIVRWQYCNSHWLVPSFPPKSGCAHGQRLHPNHDDCSFLFNPLANNTRHLPLMPQIEKWGCEVRSTVAGQRSARTWTSASQSSLFSSGFPTFKTLNGNLKPYSHNSIALKTPVTINFLRIGDFLTFWRCESSYPSFSWKGFE